MPRFQFVCRSCGVREDRICLNEEKQSQFCLLCGDKLLYEFVPTRARPVVYANDTRHPAVFTGPRQRERYLKDHGLIDYGSESPDTVRKEHARAAAEREAAEDAKLEKEILEGLNELGDAGLYETIPKHVAKREERRARDEADLTGAGIGRPPDVD